MGGGEAWVGTENQRILSFSAIKFGPRSLRTQNQIVLHFEVLVRQTGFGAIAVWEFLIFVSIRVVI